MKIGLELTCIHNDSTHTIDVADVKLVRRMNDNKGNWTKIEFKSDGAAEVREDYDKIVSAIFESKIRLS